jgi:hypothetical protein
MILQLITQSLKIEKLCWILAWHNADPIIPIYFAWSAFSDELASPNTPSNKEPGKILARAVPFNSEGPQKE